jgi:hypothetical protein
MTTKTLTAILVIAVVSCGLASGQTVVKSDDGSVTVSVSSSARPAHRSRSGAWLGVRISPVPPPLAAHLASKNAGALVMNLVKGSPAHKAGVKQFDVIVGLDKSAVPNGRNLIETLGKHKAGDKVELWVMRAGKKISFPVTLSKPAPANQIKLLHEEPSGGPWNVQKDITRLHPHVMLRKKAGDWEKMDGKDLPEEIRKMLERIPRDLAPGAQPNVSVKAKTVIHTKDSKGSDVRIETDETGKITVRRKQRNDDGAETDETKTYKDREHLRLSDPDAFDLLKKSNVKVFTSVKPGQLGKRPRGPMPEIRLFTGGDHAKLNKEIRESILKSIEQMELPADMKKQIIKQLQSQRQFQGDNDEKDDKPKKPRKKRKTKTPKKPKTPGKPKVENTSVTHV